MKDFTIGKIEQLTRVPANETPGKRRRIYTAEYIERHEKSMLKLLADKYPDEAIRYGREGMQANGNQ